MAMAQDLFNLAGKVALVTGGSKGLGKAMARGLAQSGADVLITSRHEEELRPALDEILQGTGRKGRYLVADMSVDPSTNRLYIADGYGNRRILIVDAASGQYIGHFGAYGQNPVVDDPRSGVADTEVGPWIADYRAGNLKPLFFRSPRLPVRAGSSAQTGQGPGEFPRWPVPAPWSA